MKLYGKMKKLIFLSCVVLLVLTACRTGEDVSFTVAENYFCNGETPTPASEKITSQQEFDRHFGMAAFMGKGGGTTRIDFSKQFAIVKVLPETFRSTEIRLLSMKKKGSNTLALTYQICQGDAQEYITRPFLIVLVNNRYKDFDIEEHVAE